MKLYDKRDDFNFPIVNFPFICNNIPAAPPDGVNISQLIRYSRACGSYHDFLDGGLLLTRKLLNQGFINDNGYVPLVVTISQSFPHLYLISGFVTRLTRQVPLVEQELPTLPDQLSSLPVLVGCVLLDLSFMCMFCRSLFVLLYFFF